MPADYKDFLIGNNGARVMHDTFHVEELYEDILMQCILRNTIREKSFEPRVLAGGIYYNIIMAVLERNLQDQIDNKRFEANKFFKTDKNEYFKLKQQAWDLYPEPKNNWNEAYALAKDLFRVYIFESDLEKAKNWLNEMVDNNNNLHLFDDDLTYNVGKYYFESGDYKNALEKWRSVIKDAGLRYFESEKKEYLDFYNNPGKLLK